MQTDFYEELIKIIEEIQVNITKDKLEYFGKIMEQFGLKVINPKEEDRINILHYLYEKKIQ